MKRKVTIEKIDEALARWQTRLKRAVNTIERLQRQRKRIVAKETKAWNDLAIAPPGAKAVKPRPVTEPAPPMRSPEPPAATVPEIDTAIPAFLKRSDMDAADQIRQEQADTKRRKAQGRIATMKAKKSGETRKMPLTGKAALAAIRGA